MRVGPNAKGDDFKKATLVAGGIDLGSAGVGFSAASGEVMTSSETFRLARARTSTKKFGAMSSSFVSSRVFRALAQQFGRLMSSPG